MIENYSKSECLYPGKSNSPFASLSPVNSLDSTPRHSIDSQLTEPELADCGDDDDYDRFVQKQLQEWYHENDKASRPPSPPLKRAHVVHRPVKKFNLPSTIIEEEEDAEEIEPCHEDKSLNIIQEENETESGNAAGNLQIIGEEDEEMEVINDVEDLNEIQDVKEAIDASYDYKNLHFIQSDDENLPMEESTESHKHMASLHCEDRIIDDHEHETANINASEFMDNTEFNESTSGVNAVQQADDIAIQYIRESDCVRPQEKDVLVDSDIVGDKRKTKKKWYKKLLRKLNIKKKISKLLNGFQVKGNPHQ